MAFSVDCLIPLEFGTTLAVVFSVALLIAMICHGGGKATGAGVSGGIIATLISMPHGVLGLSESDSTRRSKHNEDRYSKW